MATDQPISATTQIGTADNGVEGYSSQADLAAALAPKLPAGSIPIAALPTASDTANGVVSLAVEANHPSASDTEAATPAYVSKAVKSESKVYIYGTTAINGAGLAGGVIRNSGTGWAPIIDANHNGLVGFDQTITVSNNTIILTPNPPPSKNFTNLWVPDGTFATHGMFVGASSGVGPNAKTILTLASPASIRIAMGAPPTFVLGNSAHTSAMTVHWAMASYTVSGATGAVAVGDVVTAGGISCTVTFVDGNRIDVAGRNNTTDKYQPLPDTGTMTTAGGYSATISSRSMSRAIVIKHLPVANNNGVTANYDCSVQPRFRVDFAVQQFSNTETRLMPYGPSLPAQIQLSSGGVWSTIGGAGIGGLDRERNGGNAWSFVWNAGQNALDVTHPEVVDPLDLSAQSLALGVHAVALPVNATTARIRFVDVATQTVINPTTAPNTSFNVIMRRGGFPLYNLWTGHLRANLPVLQLNPEFVANAIANFWGIVAYDVANPN
jgi:hypothetical protein